MCCENLVLDPLSPEAKPPFHSIAVCPLHVQTPHGGLLSQTLPISTEESSDKPCTGRRSRVRPLGWRMPGLRGQSGGDVKGTE